MASISALRRYANMRQKDASKINQLNIDVAAESINKMTNTLSNVDTKIIRKIFYNRKFNDKLFASMNNSIDKLIKNLQKDRSMGNSLSHDAASEAERLADSLYLASRRLKVDIYKESIKLYAFILKHANEHPNFKEWKLKYARLYYHYSKHLFHESSAKIKNLLPDIGKESTQAKIILNASFIQYAAMCAAYSAGIYLDEGKIRESMRAIDTAFEYHKLALELDPYNVMAKVDEELRHDLFIFKPTVNEGRYSASLLDEDIGFAVGILYRLHGMGLNNSDLRKLDKIEGTAQSVFGRVFRRRIKGKFPGYESMDLFAATSMENFGVANEAKSPSSSKMFYQQAMEFYKKALEEAGAKNPEIAQAISKEIGAIKLRIDILSAGENSI